MAQGTVYLVTDTSWWLDQGWRIAVDVVDRLEDGDPFFFVPAGVMCELDGLKRDPKRGKRALEATKRIHELVSMGRCRIVEGNGRRRGVLASPVDEEVVEIARALGEKTGNVYLLTIDRAQMAVAENIPIRRILLRGKFSSILIPILVVFTAPISIPMLFLYQKIFKPEKKCYLFLAPLPHEEHFLGNANCNCGICDDRSVFDD